MLVSWRSLRAAFCLFTSIILSLSCGDDDNGRGGGGVGAACASHAQCPTGFCCRSKECGDGMCTYRCDRDFDCPAGTLCEHGTCFFACRADVDCAVGQKCKHDGVCEWD